MTCLSAASSPQGDPDYDGRSCIYRLGFKCQLVYGWPEAVQMNGVHILVDDGPIPTQRVDVRQRVPPPLIFDKVMLRGIKVGENEHVCQCLVPVEWDGSVSVDRQMRLWRDQALGAAGLLASLFDERFFLEEWAQVVETIRTVRRFAAQAGVF